MKNFEINAIAIKENTGDYTINRLFTYSNFMTLEECYKQLYIWSHHYRYTIMQYIIKKGNQVVEIETYTGALGIDIIENDNHSTKNQLEGLRLKLVKELKNKLGLENN